MAASILRVPAFHLRQEAVTLYWFVVPLIYDHQLREQARLFLKDHIGKRQRHERADFFRKQIERVQPNKRFLSGLIKRRSGSLQIPLLEAANSILTEEQRKKAEAFWNRQTIHSPQGSGTHNRERIRQDAVEMLEEEKRAVIRIVGILDDAKIPYAYKDLWNISKRKELLGKAEEKLQAQLQNIRKAMDPS